ncbi:hypothetical protein SLEP1_g23519 [Rubroshorea leprosula]|uniref:Uncharacterized protein n=1 Tax=Rubroshorea leprosula TaxID=152421 RepID=A0AAV5JCT0_9ROSI|nr:hypothetical protein SLEP1_g23519 [Rubroshorea leprosula]
MNLVTFEPCAFVGSSHKCTVSVLLPVFGRDIVP